MSIADTLGILRSLADGRWYSGQVLAEAEGISRAGVWQRIQRLESLGLRVFAVRGKGYRLSEPLDLLDVHDIRQAAGLSSDEIDIECVPVTGSTNAEVMGAADLMRPRALLAEFQTEGRGRRGNTWQQPFAAGLCLSLGIEADSGANDGSAQLAMLPLAVGVALQEQLQQLGFDGLGLKWPNDLYLGDCKLGGILIEHRGEVAGRSRIVMGLGLNIRVAPTPEQSPQIDTARLLDAWQGTHTPPSRSAIAGAAIRALLQAVTMLGQQSRESIVERWVRHDMLCGRQIQVRDGEQVIAGRYAGLNADGALLMSTEQGQRRFLAGDVSLRPL